jgi:hypothetical protein
MLHKKRGRKFIVKQLQYLREFDVFSEIMGDVTS